MSLSILGWLIVGLVAGFLARRYFPAEFMTDNGNLGMIGAIGALAGGGLAYLCRFNLYLDNPAHWILAVAGAIVTLSLRFLSVQPRTIY